MRKVIFILALFGLGISIVMMVVPSYGYKKEQQDFIELKDMVNNVKDKSNDVLKYDKLYQINNDIIGWIRIEGTNIDYPVMYSKEDYDYYLNHSFYKEYSLSGTPFVSKNYRYDNNNILIYGHNVYDETIFGELLKYGNKDFYDRHQFINFDSLEEDRIYQIVYVFKMIVTGSEDEFKYYKMDYNMDRDEFNYYIDNVSDMALYDTGIDIYYGDNLITLSTCINDIKNGRFVVVAKLIK